MKRIITFSILLFSATQLLGQTQPNKRLAEASKIYYGFELPFSEHSNKTIPDDWTQTIRDNDIKLNRIYDTAGKITEPAGEADMYFSFKVEGTDLRLCGLSMEDGPVPCTTALILVDSEGRIWDVLYAAIESNVFCTKCFRITENLDIIVYSIVPSNGESINLWGDIMEFTGYRQDCVYRIQDKKFVLVGTKKGQDRLIKATDFGISAGHYYLWEPFWAI